MSLFTNVEMTRWILMTCFVLIDDAFWCNSVFMLLMFSESCKCVMCIFITGTVSFYVDLCCLKQRSIQKDRHVDKTNISSQCKFSLILAEKFSWDLMICLKSLETCDVGCSCSGSEPSTVIDVRHAGYSQSPTPRFNCSPDVVHQSLTHQVSCQPRTINQIATLAQDMWLNLNFIFRYPDVAKFNFVHRNTDR